MKANVFITLRERGKIVARREGHNVFVDLGRQWLSNYISLLPGDVPADPRSIRYMGVGIGGIEQTEQAMVTSPPISLAYPVGFDPHGTSGFEYKDYCPISPTITTLELPVRVFGSQNPYSVPTLIDEWLVDMAPGWPYGGIITHPTPYSTAYRIILDGSLGHVVYGTFTEMPISEAGLYNNFSLNPTGFPYGNTLFAYHNFPAVIMTTAHTLEIIWHVRF